MRGVVGLVLLFVGIVLGFALGMALSAHEVHESQQEYIRLLQTCPEAEL